MSWQDHIDFAGLNNYYRCELHAFKWNLVFTQPNTLPSLKYELFGVLRPFCLMKVPSTRPSRLRPLEQRVRRFYGAEFPRKDATKDS